MARRTNKTGRKSVEALTHEEATRKNIPTAEYQSVMQKEEQSPVRVAYERRNRDLDPQLVWRGKDEQDWSDLVVHAPPLYIQEKVHPKVLIDDLLSRTEADQQANEEQVDLFAHFNGLPDDSAKTEFYRHEANWTNRMILGDSLQVMASLAEREGLRGQVQCIYVDPPYGIKFNSNFQWSTTSRDVKDGNVEHITREPEQVRAFRDTWRDGIHSYLTYLRDRLTVARDLLSDSGSMFVQIGDENVHRVRALMDEVFGDANFCAQVSVRKTSGLSNSFLPGTQDFLLWYAKRREQVKYRQLYRDKLEEAATDSHYSTDSEGRLFRLSDLTGPFSNTPSCIYAFEFQGKEYQPSRGRQWKTTKPGMTNLARANRISSSPRMIYYRRLAEDFPVRLIDDTWHDISGSVQSRNDPKVYVVQTGTPIVQRCLLMASDPGDLVLDPTCGAGTTAYIAEQWGRRWITIDTSRVALALARTRIMGTRYPYYMLQDSPDGQKKHAEITGVGPSSKSTRGDVRQGFVYERVPRITLETFSKNKEIGVIWERYQGNLDSLRNKLNVALGEDWHEWEIPPEVGEKWSAEAKRAHEEWSQQIKARQVEIDKAVSTSADFEFLYDKPYEDKNIVRVAGPFTVESLSPHRVLGVDENEELIDSVADGHAGYSDEADFVRMILENLKTAGVQQAHKEDKITLTALTPWPGDLICAEGRYVEGGSGQDEGASGPEKRAAVFIGPEFGTVSRPDLVAAAREAGDADFDVLIACAFNYDAHSSEFDKLGRIPVLKARMNADLHMADDLKNTGKGNLFVIFGEPDIDILEAEDGQIQVKVNGVDVFHPQTGEVRSDGPEGIACWFIDTDYNEESFFVRHAYFLGANDPYKALKTTLKAEINEDAWATLQQRHVPAVPQAQISGRIAVKGDQPPGR
jgi:adenine-specific DNA-methyltransferase